MVDAVVEQTPQGVDTCPPSNALTQSVVTTTMTLLGLVPFSCRGTIGWLVGYLAGLFPSRERRIASLQLQRFLASRNSSSIVPKVFANAGRTLLESINLRPIIKQRESKIRCANWPAIRAWVQDTRPIVALTAHTGNWDLLAAYVIAEGIPLTTIGREARNPIAQSLLKGIREGYGIETIWRSDRSGVKRLFECLRERRTIAALIDQDTRVDSLMVPFFGSPAKTPSSLIAMGRRANARFVSAFLFRSSPRTFEVFVEELPDSGDDKTVLEEYNRRLEALIRRFPDQWVWFHKRWRTQADGTTLSTRDYLEHLSAQIGHHPFPDHHGLRS